MFCCVYGEGKRMIKNITLKTVCAALLVGACVVHEPAVAQRYDSDFGQDTARGTGKSEGEACANARKNATDRGKNTTGHTRIKKVFPCECGNAPDSDGRWVCSVLYNWAWYRGS